MARYYEYEEYHRRPARDHSPDHYAGGPIRMNPPLSPSSDSRPRSVPPVGAGAVVRRPDSRASSRASSPSSITIGPRRRRRASGYADDASDDERRSTDSPIDKARNFAQDNFTNSTAGIGAGLIGAVVGGLIARGATEAATAHMNHTRAPGRDVRGRTYDDDEEAAREVEVAQNRARVVSTILGAVAGGLGANALANRFEDSRERMRLEQSAWEARHGPEEGLPHYDSGRAADLNHRSGRGRLGYDRRDSYESDDDYDHIYDEPRHSDERRLRRRRSDDDYRYR